MRLTITFLLILLVAGCAQQSPRLKDVEPNVSEERQKQAQQAVMQSSIADRLVLKRKIAVGKITNETTYGKSLLGNNSGNELAKKVADMFVQSLENSGNYLIFERPGIELVEAEAKLVGGDTNLVGVDTLVMGSLTEFGRSTTGEAGFLSSSKKQEARATVDLRLVDTKTGRVFSSVTGTGASSTESATTMGFGSVASYDGSINDQAIGAAINAAVEKLNKIMLEKAWSADILSVENNVVYISGGKHQGVKAGQIFDVYTKGNPVKSNTTGAMITLPGKKVAELVIEGTFGNDELNEGAYGSIQQGSINGLKTETLEVREQK